MRLLVAGLLLALLAGCVTTEDYGFAGTRHYAPRAICPDCGIGGHHNGNANGG